MKVIHSYWSKPNFKKGSTHIYDRNTGGWVDKKYNYMSWALSCLQFKKYYGNIELVTDLLGYDLLVNKMNLPYSNVNVCLDELNDYHPDLWALGKIYAYSLQNEPFIHADGDVYIYKKFDCSFEKSPIISQNIERGYDLYKQVYKNLENTLVYIPGVLIESKNINNQIIAINAGIIGGTNVDFFKSFAKEAFLFVDKNKSILNRINIGLFNIIYEQALLYALAENKKIEINYYLKDANQAFDGLCDFINLPGQNGYLHAIGPYKQQKTIGDNLAYRLQSDYPEFYYKIMNLLRTNQL